MRFCTNPDCLADIDENAKTCSRCGEVIGKGGGIVDPRTYSHFLDRHHGGYTIQDHKGPIVYLDDAPRFHNGEPCGNLTSRGRTPAELLELARLYAGANTLANAVDHHLHAIAGDFGPDYNLEFSTRQLRAALEHARPANPDKPETAGPYPAQRRPEP